MSKKVVIIGGGLSAKHSAELLCKRKDTEVTIIQANQFVEWPLAMAAVLIKPELHGKAVAANPATFQVPGVKYKYGVAASVNFQEKLVMLGSQEAVPYDALLVATGFKMSCLYPSLGVTLEARKAEVQNIAAGIAKASCVVVAGGGPVGLEIVGNIRLQYPDKKLILLSKSNVASFLGESQRLRVESQLKKMKVEIVVGPASDAPSDYSLTAGTLKVGQQDIAYDVYLPVYSQGPNTSFLAGDDNILDERKCVQVNDFLQSVSFPELFAVGVSNRKEAFVGMAKLEPQWISATTNVKALLDGKSMKAHKEGMPFMKGPPLIVIGHGARGWGMFDFANMPPPCKCCCCCGYAGFPCCPPCWPCCGCGGCGCCPCGYCGGRPEGSGPAKLAGKMAFMSSGFHFKGMGQVAPAQQSM